MKIGSEIQPKCKTERVCRRGSSTAKGGGKYEEFKFWKANSELGRPILGHCNGGSWSILLRGYGGKTTPPTLEREQSEEVLPPVVTIIMDISCCN